jgi:hypothetical protein
MKRLILAATLAIAVPAFAQDAATPPADASAPAAAPADTATPPAEPAAPAAAPAAPAAAPAAASAGSTAAPDTSSYPVCTAKVTDRCIEKASSPRKWRKKK